MLIHRNINILLSDIQQVLSGECIELSKESSDAILKSFDFLQKFAGNKTIYGINTGLGPMAQYKVDDDKQVELQYNLIRSHCAGLGKNIDNIYARTVMICRLISLAKGSSGVHPSVPNLLVELINRDICPLIPEHGSVGASGDLVQLSHLAMVLIGEGEVMYNGAIRKTSEVFEENGLQPIKIILREGLALINGTSVMTAIGLINISKAKLLLSWSVYATALLSEIVESLGDYFSERLNKAKCHEGQQLIAQMLREILADSKLIRSREDEFFNGCHDKIHKRKVQEYYSIRCLPQILGPVLDTINYTEKVVVNELNSVSDNPVIDPELENVFHGGNFHGDYVSLEMDKLKLVITRIAMLAERQLNFLFNKKLNDKLPPFINLGVLGLNLGMQGAQFTATSTTAECQTLSTSMYIHSIPTNNDNQDIVSMGTNAALLAARVIDNAFQVMAVEMMSLLQAVDYLKIQTELSSRTRKVYTDLRKLVPIFVSDSSKYLELNTITEYLKNHKPD